MSIRKFWHITLMHTGSAKMFHLSLSRVTNIFLLSAFLILCGGMTYTLHYIHGKKAEIDHLKSLKVQNRALRQNLAQISKDIDTLQVQIDLVVDGEETLRQQSDLPAVDAQIRAMGAGGMPTVEESPAFDEQLNATYQNVQEKADQLTRVADFCMSTHRDLWQNMKLREQVDSFTPSIYPTFGGFSSGFGPRVDPITHGYEFHKGLDIVNDPGTPVYATADGVIMKSGYNGGGYGNMVEIAHRYGYSTRYGHMAQTLVNVGQHVKKGQIIGLMGSTGRSTGTHLHYEVMLYGANRNPKAYLKPMDTYGLSASDHDQAVRLGYLPRD